MEDEPNISLRFNNIHVQTNIIGKTENRYLLLVIVILSSQVLNFLFEIKEHAKVFNTL